MDDAATQSAGQGAGQSATQSASRSASPGLRPGFSDASAGGDEQEDVSLMLAYAAGDAQAFARLYDRHERPVYRFLLRSLGNTAQAEELLQDTWMAVVRSAPTYAPQARFTTWLYGIARNKLIDHWRAQRDVVSLDAEHADAANDADAPALIDTLPAEPSAQPEVQALTKAQARALADAVQQLPPAQREAFLLHTEAGMSLEELAQLTGVGTETAKSRLRYAYARLRTLLAEWRDEADEKSPAVPQKEPHDSKQDKRQNTLQDKPQHPSQTAPQNASQDKTP